MTQIFNFGSSWARAMGASRLRASVW